MSGGCIRLTILSAFLLGSGILAAWATPAVSGQEQVKKAKKPPKAATGVITIERAQVKLIDQVELAAAREGILKFVEPREGDLVQADQIVAGLKDEVARAEYDTAKAQAENDIEVRYATKAFEFAKKDLEKSQAANKQTRRAFSDIDIEEKLLAAGKADLQIEQAKWQFDINKRKADAAQAVLEEFSVAAPFDGMVTDVKKSKGEAVRAGDIILEITSTRRLKVEGMLHYKDAWQIKQGMPVTVTLDVDEDILPAKQNSFKGRVKFVALEVNSVAKDVLITAEVENAEGIMRAGLEATMTIDLRSTDKREVAR